MRLLIFSDAHSNEKQMAHLLQVFVDGGYDYLICCGDIVNFGSLHGLKPKSLAMLDLLNPYANKILACKGNNDAIEDQYLWQFPMDNDHLQLFIDQRRWYITHGDHYDFDDLPPLPAGSIFVCGHSHIANLCVKKHVLCLNPGSLSTPRDERAPSYATYDGEVIQVRSFTGDIFYEHRLMN
jgi:putative phosphoesterase